ncbi:MAG: SpoIIIAH-like family protein [Eubacterium sp.]|nr:SpoIIIAH-like family protein [Eubacterium sp.]
MRRINLIIRRKHLIIAGLALVLCVGLYANYAISSSVNASAEADAENYGDATFVSANVSGQTHDKDTLVTDDKGAALSGTDAYFAQARIDKKNSRAEAAEVLQSVYAGGDLTRDEMAVIAQDAETMTDLMEAETKIETMLKAQGFDDVLCYLSGKSANIIVKTAGLDSAQAAQIKSALLSEVDIAGENITIVEVQ